MVEHSAKFYLECIPESSFISIILGVKKKTFAIFHRE